MKKHIVVIEDLNTFTRTLPPAASPEELALVFTTPSVNARQIYHQTESRGYTPFLVSGGGQFAQGHITDQGAVVITLELPPKSYKIKSFPIRDIHSGLEKAREAGLWIRQQYTKPQALVFISGTHLDCESMLEILQHAAGDEVTFYGALAGLGPEHSTTHIGLEGEIFPLALGVIVFDSSLVKLSGIAVSSWKSLGIPKTITRSEGNVVYEIDSQPVKKFYQDYFDFDNTDSIVPYMEYPLQLKRSDGTHVMRVIMDNEKDGLRYSGKIPQGSTVFFSSPDISDAVRHTYQALKDYQEKQAFHENTAVLVFSCVLRRQAFAFYIQNELDVLESLWPRHYAGLFSFGEISQTHDEKCALHNTVLSVVFLQDLTEPSKEPLSPAQDSSFAFHHVEISSQVDAKKTIAELQSEKRILTRLLQRTSKDLHGALQSLEFAKEKMEASFVEELEETQREVLFTMGAIGENRSRETGNHVRRVAEYSRVLALAAGMNLRQADMLKQASPMHDIGKVAIPDAILNKPGTLTPEEFNYMKKHAILGHEMLRHSKLPLLKMAATVALEHHERWDGTGYPRGLKGKDISLVGRITAVADVFDALGSPRIYKPAWKDEAIFALFRKERGHQFDPFLINLFFENLSQLLQIREHYQDKTEEKIEILETIFEE